MALAFSNLVQRFEMMADWKTMGMHVEKKVLGDKVGWIMKAMVTLSLKNIWPDQWTFGQRKWYVHVKSCASAAAIISKLWTIQKRDTSNKCIEKK